MKPTLIILSLLILTGCSFTRNVTTETETREETEVQRLRTTFSDLSEFITITLPELPTRQPAGITDTLPEKSKHEPDFPRVSPTSSPFAGLPAGTRIEIRREERVREEETEQIQTKSETREQAETEVKREVATGFSWFWAGIAAAVITVLVILTLLRRF